MGAMVPPSRKSCYNFRVVSVDKVVDGDFDDIKLPREELRGEIDIYEPMHWHSINQMFIRNARRTQIEKNMTLPSDSINSALENFWEQENGSDGATESEELL